MPGQNIIEKIWAAHVVEQQPDHPAIFAIDFMLLHEVTSAQAFATLTQRGLAVKQPQHCAATLDHSVPTNDHREQITDPLAKQQVELLRENAPKNNIPIYDFGSKHQGIVHVIGPELGATQPGMTIVCGDSHTATHGAFGAMAFGIGTSVVAHVLATGCLLLTKPQTMRVVMDGKFNKGVYAKDAIMKLIAEIGIGGANGYVIEYCGSAISAMTMEERMTVCNMSIECGAVAGLIAPDETTFDYIKGLQHAPKAEQWQQAVTYWQSLCSDPDATFDREVVIDIDKLKPMISWGTNPQQAIAIDESIPTVAQLSVNEQIMAEKALSYNNLQAGQDIKDVPLDWAFIGSCTNGRIEDLRIAAQILDGKKVDPKVTFYIVPGSESVREQAIAEGLDKIFVACGAQFRMPGCSMCIGMNDDKVPTGKRCISSSNRNFVGRQGPGSFTHLASPATVAASAIAGKIVDPSSYL